MTINLRFVTILQDGALIPRQKCHATVLSRKKSGSSLSERQISLLTASGQLEKSAFIRR